MTRCRMNETSTDDAAKLSAIEPVRIFLDEAFSKLLSPPCSKPFTEQDSKLVHGGFPAGSRDGGLGQRITQRQP